MQSRWSGSRRCSSSSRRCAAWPRSSRPIGTRHPPSVLTDRGLGAALQALAARSAVPVKIGSLPAERLPPAVETTVDFRIQLELK